MQEVDKLSLLSRYKNIFGNAKDTINAIQKFIKSNAPENNEQIGTAPAQSINNVLNAASDEEVKSEIQKIINKL